MLDMVQRGLAFSQASRTALAAFLATRWPVMLVLAIGLAWATLAMALAVQNFLHTVGVSI